MCSLCDTCHLVESCESPPKPGSHKWKPVLKAEWRLPVTRPEVQRSILPNRTHTGRAINGRARSLRRLVKIYRADRAECKNLSSWFVTTSEWHNCHASPSIFVVPIA